MFDDHNSRVAEINKAMLTELAAKGLDDTLANRIHFLRGMRDAWAEDPSKSPEKRAYEDSLHFELSRLKTEIAWRKLT